MNLTSSSKSTVDEDGMLVVFGENDEDGNGSSWTSRSSVVNYTISTELFGKRKKLDEDRRIVLHCNIMVVIIIII